MPAPGTLHFKFQIINIKVAPLSAEQNSRETWQRLGGWKYETNFSLKYETEKFYRCLCRIFHSHWVPVWLPTVDCVGTALFCTFFSEPKIKSGDYLSIGTFSILYFIETIIFFIQNLK